MSHVPSRHLATQIRHTGADLQPKFDALNELARQLADVEFETRAPSGDVAVWMLGNGKLSDVVITEEALDRLDAKQMATLLTETISQAEQNIRDALTDVMRQTHGRKNGFGRSSRPS